MEDIFNLVDEEYGIAKQDKGFYCNMIKTKPSSFRSILSRWNDYRTKKMMEKLDYKLYEKKLNLVGSEFKYDGNQELTKHSEAKMDRLILGIAKLESKIKVLAREDVPSNYVKSRAIKLKQKMMDNLWYHSRKTYSVGIENYDKVFETNQKVSQLEPEVSYASSSEEFNRDDFQSVIDEEFRNAMKEEENTNVITPEVVAETVGADVEDNSVSQNDFVEENHDSFQPIEKDEFTVSLPFEVKDNSIDLPFSNAHEEENLNIDIPNLRDDRKEFAPIVDKDLNEKSEINIDEVKKTIDEALEEASVKYRNPSSKANIDSFDDYGRRKQDYQYVPMTDEEIGKARENIEKELYDEKYRNESQVEIKREENKDNQNVRDEIALVPESRSNVSVPSQDKEFGQNVEESTSSVTNSFDETIDFESLKASLADLNLGIESSIRSREAAEQDAEFASQKAKEARKMFEESEERKTEKLQELYYYKLALMKQKEEIEKQAQLAREEADRNRNFIAIQESRIQDNDKISNEIDMLIPDDAKPKGR